MIHAPAGGYEAVVLTPQVTWTIGLTCAVVFYALLKKAQG